MLQHRPTGTDLAEAAAAARRAGLLAGGGGAASAAAAAAGKTTVTISRTGTQARIPPRRAPRRGRRRRLGYVGRHIIGLLGGRLPPTPRKPSNFRLTVQLRLLSEKSTKRVPNRAHSNKHKNQPILFGARQCVIRCGYLFDCLAWSPTWACGWRGWPERA